MKREAGLDDRFGHKPTTSWSGLLPPFRNAPSDFSQIVVIPTFAVCRSRGCCCRARRRFSRPRSRATTPIVSSMRRADVRVVTARWRSQLLGAEDLGGSRRGRHAHRRRRGRSVRDAQRRIGRDRGRGVAPAALGGRASARSAGTGSRSSWLEAGCHRDHLLHERPRPSAFVPPSSWMLTCSTPCRAPGSGSSRADSPRTRA